MPLGVVAAVLFSAFLHAAWNGVLRQSTDRAWAAGWIGVSTFVVCAPLLPLVGIPSQVWPFILASSTLHVVYLGLLAQAYKVNELSFAYPIARGSSPMLVCLGGILVASEHTRVLQTFGIIAIVSGIVAIGLVAKHWDRKGFLLALAIGAVIATYTVIDGIGARRCGLPTQYNLWCFSIYGLAILIIRLTMLGQKALHGSGKRIAFAFGGGVTSVVAYAIVTWAMVHVQMGAVSALRETSTLFAAGIGVLFLKEKFSLQKLFGCAAIVFGAALVGLG